MNRHMRKGTLWFSDSWFFNYAFVVPYLGNKHAFFAWSFLNVSTTCQRTAKALARLRLCAGSPEPLLVASVISILFSCSRNWIYGYPFSRRAHEEQAGTATNLICVNLRDEMPFCLTDRLDPCTRESNYLLSYVYCNNSHSSCCTYVILPGSKQ